MIKKISLLAILFSGFNLNSSFTSTNISTPTNQTTKEFQCPNIKHEHEAAKTQNGRRAAKKLEALRQEREHNTNNEYSK